MRSKIHNKTQIHRSLLKYTIKLKKSSTEKPTKLHDQIEVKRNIFKYTTKINYKEAYYDTQPSSSKEDQIIEKCLYLCQINSNLYETLNSSSWGTNSGKVSIETSTEYSETATVNL